MEYLILLTILSAAFSVCGASKKSSTDVESRMNAVKSHILSKLGLEAAPNVTGQRLPKIPPLMSMLESQDLQPALQPQNAEDEYHAKTERMIVFPTRDNLLAGKAPNWWFFDFTRKKSSLKVLRAAVWIYMKNIGTAAEKGRLYFSINIYEGVYPLDVNKTPAKLLIFSRQISCDDSGWKHFKLKRTVKSWVQESQKNLGIFVELVGIESKKIVLPGQDHNLQPFLVVRTEDSGNKRRAKRLAGIDCSPKSSSSSTCCRHSLIIDFEKIGWEFVIAPKKYEAYYCTGKCDGIGYGLHQYFHTLLVDKERRRSGEKTKFCCSPSKVSPITMLYLLNDKIMYEKVPGMRIEKCGCS